MNSVLEHKFCSLTQDDVTCKGNQIEGYASYFDVQDAGGDIVARGAYTAFLEQMKKNGRRVKMLWQHNPEQPIGVWDEVREDERGLYVRGRLLDSVERGKEALALVAAGAIDGLSIGYKTVRAVKGNTGQRILKELELWEVSLVTFPMLSSARVGQKRRDNNDLVFHELSKVFEAARLELQQE